MWVLGPWIRGGESLTLARLPVVIAWKRALLVGKRGPSWPWWGGHAGEQGVNKGLRPWGGGGGAAQLQPLPGSLV